MHIQEDIAELREDGARGMMWIIFFELYGLLIYGIYRFLKWINSPTHVYIIDKRIYYFTGKDKIDVNKVRKKFNKHF